MALAHSWDREPIRDMRVDECNARLKTEYKGEPYVFCAQCCFQRFDENPQMYTVVQR